MQKPSLVLQSQEGEYDVNDKEEEEEEWRNEDEQRENNDGDNGDVEKIKRGCLRRRERRRRKKGAKYNVNITRFKEKVPEKRTVSVYYIPSNSTSLANQKKSTNCQSLSVNENHLYFLCFCSFGSNARFVSDFSSSFSRYPVRVEEFIEVNMKTQYAVCCRSNGRWQSLTVVDKHLQSLAIVGTHWQSWTMVDNRWHTLTVADNRWQALAVVDDRWQSHRHQLLWHKSGRYKLCWALLVRLLVSVRRTIRFQRYYITWRMKHVAKWWHVSINKHHTPHFKQTIIGMAKLWLATYGHIISMYFN